MTQDTAQQKVDPKGHVASERGKRLRKARKIVELLGMDLAGKRVLDLGTGAGVIAEYLASQGADVVAADRDITEFRVSGIEPVKLDALALPFEDEAFDAIVFNHVIEHVGDRPEQAVMLDEIHRCLRPGGKLYLAVPNKWALVEPHYKLPLLGALPRSIADAMVRASGRHPHYDCYPFAHGELQRLLEAKFDTVIERTGDAYFWVAENEIGGAAGKVLSSVPKGLVRALSGAMPTLIFVNTKAAQA